MVRNTGVFLLKGHMSTFLYIWKKKTFSTKHVGMLYESIASFNNSWEPRLCPLCHLHIESAGECLLQLIYTTILLIVPRLRRHNFCSLIHSHDNARPAAMGGFTGSCSLWMPLRPTTRLFGSNPSTLVQKDRPVGSCSGRFCRVLLCLCVFMDQAGGLDSARGRRESAVAYRKPPYRTLSRVCR